jgi:hypothetical protein
MAGCGLANQMSSFDPPETFELLQSSRSQSQKRKSKAVREGGESGLLRLGEFAPSTTLRKAPWRFDLVSLLLARSFSDILFLCTI